MTADNPDDRTSHSRDAGDTADALRRLLEVMAALRDPAGGCPWDRDQTFATIAPYTIEEAFEVADAIERGDMPGLKDELGDLLFQVVFHARLAEEAGAFAFADVARAIVAKMERRHPHVFGDGEVRTAAAQTRAWESHKAREREAAAMASALDGVARALPALMRAEKLQKRAAHLGFDWPSREPVIAKVGEELDEVTAELAAAKPVPERVHEEIGDLLFACVNLARHLSVDAEVALRGANDKFERRFRAVEGELFRAGKTPDGATLAEMDALWDAEKSREKAKE